MKRILLLLFLAMFASSLSMAECTDDEVNKKTKVVKLQDQIKEIETIISEYETKISELLITIEEVSR